MTAFSTHYDNLQVAQRSTDAVIRAAYRVLCQKYHPDKFVGDPAEGERIMKLINAAYVVLSDAAKRAEHDAWIREQEEEAISAEARARRDAIERSRRAAESKREANNERASAEEASRRYRASVEQKKKVTGFVEKSPTILTPPPRGGLRKGITDGLYTIFGLFFFVAMGVSLISAFITHAPKVISQISTFPKSGNQDSVVTPVISAVANTTAPVASAGWNLSSFPGSIDGRWSLILTSTPPNAAKTYIDTKSISGNTYQTAVWIRQYHATTRPVELLDESSSIYATSEFHLIVRCEERSAATEDFHYYKVDGAELSRDSNWSKGSRIFRAIKPGDGMEEAVFDLVCK